MQVIGMFEIGDVQPKYTSTGRQSGWIVQVYHKGLDEVRHLSAKEGYVLEGKVNNLIGQLNAKWERKEKALNKAVNAQDAEERTVEAQQELKLMESLLAHTLSVDDTVDWNSLKNNKPYSEDKPTVPKEISPPPKPVASSFKKKISLFKTLLGQKSKILEQQQKDFQNALSAWEKEKRSVEAENQKLFQEHQAAIQEWDKNKKNYEADQAQLNQKVEQLKENYTSKEEEAVTEYCEMVLSNSEYPDDFPSDFELQYSNKNGILVVDFTLPSLQQIPTKTSVRYVATRDAVEEKFLSEAQSKKLYNGVCYQIALRTIHELFEADSVDALVSITFNGFVTTTNPSTGHEETNCILSVQAKKEEFVAINLASVDPKSCFKALKGVGSANLATITPVKPILEMDRSDRRFRDHYEVASSVDCSTNLAAMNWEDFEHLVRELFEAEFASNGGEVRVTQASSDGGVDAVAFDPDPIRGGKIVIQAKRYTNTVGVAAVRDLYGTVMNEGATKGILVTTADYGADSYDFANGKPLTLLSGSNLLSLLEKHGTKAKIDIQEAKRILAE